MSESLTYSVPGISCDHCKRAIEDKVQPLPGVSTIDIDVDAKTVTVAGGDAAQIETAITAAGYAIA